MGFFSLISLNYASIITYRVVVVFAGGLDDEDEAVNFFAGLGGN
jgi:hypothetical protein